MYFFVLEVDKLEKIYYLCQLKYEETMIQVNQIFSERLAAARKMRRMSMDALADAVGVSKNAISKYEKGSMMPNSSVLIKLCEVLGMSVDYFFRDKMVNLGHVEFRKRARLGKMAIQSIHEHIKEFAERYIEVEKILGIPSPVSLSQYDVSCFGDAIGAAMKLRDAWQLGTDGIVGLINLLESKGVKVIEIDSHPDFDGVSGLIDGLYYFIAVNRAYNPERKRFTLAHELGHLVLDIKSDLDKEKVCHSFANEFLLPSDIFKTFMGDKRHDISLNELRAIQRAYGISVDAQMMKARVLDIISEKRLESFHKKKNFSPSFKADVEQSVFPSENCGRFEALVYMALAKDLITMSKAAALLGQSLEVVRKKLQLV